MSAYGTVETYGKYDCDNCGKRWSLDDLKEIKRYHERVTDGIEPAGECPECGALCYDATDDIPDAVFTGADLLNWLTIVDDYGIVVKKFNSLSRGEQFEALANEEFRGYLQRAVRSGKLQAVQS